MAVERSIDNMADSSKVQMSCLCGATQQLLPLEKSSLPSVAFLCHCHLCLSTSGVFCTSYLVLPSPPSSLDNLNEYPASKKVSRLSCKTCGGHVFAHIKPLNKFLVASGVLQHDGDVVKIVRHTCVGDKKDGCLSNWLPEAGGRLLPRWAEEANSSQELPPDWEGELVDPAVIPESSKKLHARCHCGGVQYYITPPNEGPRNLSSPWPDLLVPYHSGSSNNPGDVKWWLRDDDEKYLAGLCACKSCRLAAGSPIQSWAFVPKQNIFQSDDSPLSFNMGTLKAYQSSEGTYREFCGTCGATVFWHCEERPYLIDVSVGLLGALSGARAEDWLVWAMKGVSFAEKAQDMELVQSVEKGLKDWRGLGAWVDDQAVPIKERQEGKAAPMKQ